MERRKSSSDDRVVLHRVRIRDTWVYEADGYIYWPDNRVRGWRWAKKEWEDDGVGVQHHGACETLAEAVAAARTHAASYPDFRA